MNNNDLETITISALEPLGAIGSTALPSLTTIDLSSLSMGANGSSGTDLLTASPNTVWTTNTTGTGVGYNWNTVSPATTIHQNGRMELKGEQADIEINGRSMAAWMEKVEERLNILTPNPELEKEWDELRRLGERYRKLEKKCKEKAEVWNKLKSMPPPKI